MAEQNIIEVLIRAVDETSRELASIKNNIASLEKTVESTGSTFTKTGASLVVFNQTLDLIGRAASFVSGPIREMTLQASEAEETFLRFKGTLIAFNSQIDPDKFKDFAEELGKISGVGDHAVISAATMLQSFRRLDQDGLERATKAAINLSKFLGGDLNSAALRLGLVLSGMSDRIRPIGQIVSKTTPEVDKVNVALTNLEQRTAGVAATSGSAADKQRQLNTAFEALYEALGTPLLDKLKFTRSITIDIVHAMTEFVKVHPSVVTGIVTITAAIAGAGGLAAALKYIPSAVGLVIAALNLLMAHPIVTTVTLAVTALASAIAYLKKESYDLDLKNLTPENAPAKLKLYTDKLNELRKQIGGLNEEIAGALLKGETETQAAEKDPVVRALIAKRNDLEARMKAMAAAQQTATQTIAGAKPPAVEPEMFSPEFKNKIEAAQQATKEQLKQFQIEVTATQAEVQATFQAFNAETFNDIEGVYQAFLTRTNAAVAKAVANADQQRQKLLTELGQGTPEQVAAVNQAFAGITSQAALMARLQVLKEFPGILGKIAEMQRKAVDQEGQQLGEINKTKVARSQVSAAAIADEIELANLRGESADKILKLLREQAAAEKATLSIQLNGALEQARITEEKAMVFRDGTAERALALQQAVTQRTEAEKLNQQIQQIDTNLAKTVQSGQAFTSQLQLAASVQSGIESNLREQLDLMVNQNQSWADIRAQIDRLTTAQKESLELERQRLNILISENEALAAQGQGNPQVLAKLKAELEAVDIKLANIPLNVKRLVDSFDPLSEAGIQISRDIGSAFGNLFDNLTDTSVSFGKRLENLFADLGKTIWKTLFNKLVIDPLVSDMMAGMDELLGKPTDKNRQSALGQTWKAIAGLFGGSTTQTPAPQQAPAPAYEDVRGPGTSHVDQLDKEFGDMIRSQQAQTSSGASELQRSASLLSTAGNQLILAAEKFQSIPVGATPASGSFAKIPPNDSTALLTSDMQKFYTDKVLPEMERQQKEFARLASASPETLQPLGMRPAETKDTGLGASTADVLDAEIGDMLRQSGADTQESARAMSDAAAQQAGAAGKHQEAAAALISAANQLAAASAGTQGPGDQPIQAMGAIPGGGTYTEGAPWSFAKDMGGAVQEQSATVKDSTTNMASLGTTTMSVVDSFGRLIQSADKMGGPGGTVSKINAGFGIAQSVLGMLSKVFSMFGKGGMVVPRGIPAFAHGTVVKGPTIGLIGEEGPEIVARMKPARPSDTAGEAAPTANMAEATDALGTGANSLGDASLTLDSAGLSLDTAGSSLDIAGFTLDQAGLSMDSAAMNLDASAMILNSAASTLAKAIAEKSLADSRTEEMLHSFTSSGLMVPKGLIRKFQHGGVVRQPTIGMIGEEGPEVVARLRPANARDQQQQNKSPEVKVEINGDITPRRPDMKPEDIIRVIVNNGERKGPVGDMVRNIIRRSR